MKTLQLHDGDFVLGTGGYATISGPAQIVQDLRGALLEPLGNDRFHPGYGSQLDTLVGLVGDVGSSFEVRQEVLRVVQNYVAVQRDKIERDALSGVKSRYLTNEVISDVPGVGLTMVGDTATVMVAIKTISGDTAELTSTLGA